MVGMCVDDILFIAHGLLPSCDPCCGTEPRVCLTVFSVDASIMTSVPAWRAKGLIARTWSNMALILSIRRRLLTYCHQVAWIHKPSCI